MTVEWELVVYLQLNSLTNDLAKMQNRLFEYARRIVLCSSLLFALQTTAQTVVTYHNKDIEESKDYQKGINPCFNWVMENYGNVKK